MDKEVVILCCDPPPKKKIVNLLCRSSFEEYKLRRGSSASKYITHTPEKNTNCDKISAVQFEEGEEKTLPRELCYRRDRLRTTVFHHRSWRNSSRYWPRHFFPINPHPIFLSSPLALLPAFSLPSPYPNPPCPAPTPSALNSPLGRTLCSKGLSANGRGEPESKLNYNPAKKIYI